MANSKVQLADGTVLIDLTADTVAASTLRQGATAHDKAGNAITGTLVPGITPSGTLSITDNGSYDVTNYASANVQTKAYLSDNLHNFATDVPNTYIGANDGSVIAYTGWTSTDYIPVDNTSYYFLNKTNTYYGCYDANKNYIAFSVGGITQFSNTSIKYFRASFSDADMANYNIRKLIVGEIQPSVQTQSKTATDNGDVYPDSGYHLAKVTVNVPFQVYRTGSGAPPASLGEDGDLYLDLSSASKVLYIWGVYDVLITPHYISRVYATGIKKTYGSTITATSKAISAGQPVINSSGKFAWEDGNAAAGVSSSNYSNKYWPADTVGLVNCNTSETSTHFCQITGWSQPLYQNATLTHTIYEAYNDYDIHSRGAFTGAVISSYSQQAYPQDGEQSGLWYTIAATIVLD